MKKIMAEISRLLRPRPRRLQVATERAAALSRLLVGHEYAGLRVRRAAPYGSLYRNTAIAAFKDVDLLLELEPQSGAERPNSLQAIRDLAGFLEGRADDLRVLGRVEVWSQSHSVGVEFPEYQLRVDIVPALVTDDEEEFLIPQTESIAWLSTRPDDIAKGLDELEGDQPRVRTAVRFLKGWRRAKGLGKVPGYGMEVAVLRVAQRHGSGAPASALSLVREVLKELSQGRYDRRLRLFGDKGHEPVVLKDPWTGHNVMTRLNAGDRGRLIDASEVALQDLHDVFRSLDLDDRDWAMELARSLFVGKKWLARIDAIDRRETRRDVRPIQRIGRRMLSESDS
jgi:hypothetical protein